MILGTAVHGERLLTERYHSNFWVLLLFQYHGELVVDGQRLVVAPGMAGVFPPDATLTIRYRGRSSHRYAHLALPTGRLGKDVPIAALRVLGRAARDFDAGFEQAIRAHVTSPERAKMVLWDLLWRLADATRHDLPAAVSTRQHPHLTQAMELIELRLDGTVRIADLAREIGLSARHLGNHFHAAYGISPVAYVRQRRMERARLLLTQTNTPISRIAADVGIPDIQAFNKAIRRAFGASPREVRSTDASHRMSERVQEAEHQ